MSCLAAIGSAVGGSEVAAQDPNVDTLINRLGDPNYKARERATKDVADFLQAGTTTPEQRQKVRDAAEGNASPEIRWRAAAALGFYNENLPQVKMALDLTKVKATGQSPLGVLFEFDTGIKGAAPLRLVDDIFQAPEFTFLRKLEKDFKDSLRRGDLQGAETALDNMQTLFENRGVFFLNADGIPQLECPQSVKDKLEEARQKLNSADNEQKLAFGNTPAGPQGNRPVAGPGPVDTGQTFRMSLEGVDQTGELIVDSGPLERAISAPPAGFQFVGNFFDVTTADVIVNGLVDLTIEFGIGDEQALNFPVNDSLPLQMVRFANGNFEFLPTNVDLASRTASAAYFAEPIGALDLESFEQFGMFALVQVIPEPSGIVLTVVGLLGTTGLRSRR